MARKLRIGVFGAYRGEMMINFARKKGEVELVAVCCKPDSMSAKLKKAKGFTIYENFDDFIKHDMDAVVLANYAHEHVPYAIRCLKAGKHVLSEVLGCATLKEAVELIETVESTGLVYSYAENYCYMPAMLEMSMLYKEGAIGEFEYGEGEYVHNCEPIWPDITYGDPNHWRNGMTANFYCTHSIGPILHMTKLRPVSVTGFELPFSPRTARMGARSGTAGIEMITLENGAILKSLHGNLDKNSIWCCVYGTKGRMESAREDAEVGDIYTLYTNIDSSDGVWDGKPKKYSPRHEFADKAQDMGHGGSDYYPMHWFIEACNGNKNADIIDVYEAIDMTLPGLLGYFSVLDGGIPKRIPNLRLKEERDAVRNDDRRVEIDYPSYSKSELDIDSAVYERIKKIYEENRKNKK